MTVAARCLSLVCLLLLAHCSEAPVQEAERLLTTDTDALLQEQVSAALINASDLPPDLQVAVEGGVVTVSGSLGCEDCGGMRTPGNTGTIQQSLGSVVRAVPGVTSVNFQLDYTPILP